MEIVEHHLNDLDKVESHNFFLSEQSISTGIIKTIPPEFFKKYPNIEFPGVGPCIVAVIHLDADHDALAMHIDPHLSPEKVNHEIEDFLNHHSDTDNWQLEYLIRQNEDKTKTYFADTVTDNKQNVDNLADTDEHFPGRIKSVKARFITTPDGVNQFGWDHQRGFHLLTSPKI